MIYFIQEGNKGPVKIGYAIDPKARLKQLQTGNSEKLLILKVIPGDEQRESKIHGSLEQFRKRGEWFFTTKEVLDFINKLDEPEFELLKGKAYVVLRRKDEDSDTEPCPFCGLRHSHGSGDGHRVAHCYGSDIRQEIQLDGVTLRKRDGYIVRTGGV